MDTFQTLSDKDNSATRIADSYSAGPGFDPLSAQILNPSSKKTYWKDFFDPTPKIIIVSKIDNSSLQKLFPCFITS